MIGQEKVLQKLDKILQSFPRFIIICGMRGSGKTLLAEYVAQKLEANLVLCGNKVDEVRETITLAHKQSQRMLYLFENCDKMSNSAKNALLKITEEPPKNAFFIMNTTDKSAILETLISRAMVIDMLPYTLDEFRQYLEGQQLFIDDKELEMAHEICETPGMLDLYLNLDEHFISTMQKILEHIGKVNGANAFKINGKFKYKEDDVGYDLELSFRTIIYLAVRELKATRDVRYADTVRITSKYLSQLRTSGINKSSTVDMWILEMRGVWVE